MTYIILIIIAAAVAFFVYRKKASPRPQPKKAAQPTPKPRYASVKLITGRSPCTGARELAGQPLLAGEAPSLPLPNCTQTTCNCSFRKLGDRRQDEDGRRSSDIGIEPIMYSGRESRKSFDRRDPF